MRVKSLSMTIRQLLFASRDWFPLYAARSMQKILPGYQKVPSNDSDVAKWATTFPHCTHLTRLLNSPRVDEKVFTH